MMVIDGDGTRRMMARVSRPTLSIEQQLAVCAAYRGLVLNAKEHVQQHRCGGGSGCQLMARDDARRARNLLSAFPMRPLTLVPE